MKKERERERERERELFLYRKKYAQNGKDWQIYNKRMR